MSNSVQLNKKVNAWIFLGCVALAIPMLVGSGLAIKKVLEQTSSPVKVVRAACLDSFKKFNFKTETKNDGSITGTFSDMSQLESSVYKSGVIMGACPSYTLYAFCAGADCETNPGVSFTLKPKE